MDPYYIYLRPSDDKATIVQANDNDLLDYDPERFLRNTHNQLIHFDTEEQAKSALNRYVKKEYIDVQHLDRTSHWRGKLKDASDLFGIDV
jgi:hypothetical protein